MAPSENQIWAYLRPAIVRDLIRRGRNVQTRAKDNIRGLGSGPRRVRTGDLLNSIRMETFFAVSLRSRNDRVRVGTNERHALWVHDGTGIYGPRRQRIVPREAQALRFYWDRTGRVMILRSVAGMRPNHFLRNALDAARDS